MSSDQDPRPLGAKLSPAKAELLGRWRAGAFAAPAPAIRAHPGAEGSPASLQQARHWYRRDRRTNQTKRNIAFAALLEAPLDYDELARSVDAVAQRHESLRTTLYEESGDVWQRVHPDPMVRHDRADLRNLSRAGHTAPSGQPAALDAAVDAVNDVLREGFDLASGPLARTLVYRLTDTTHLFAIVCNHVVADGWSLGVAVAELDEIYQSRVQGRAHSLRPLPIQYRDYARWQREWLTGAQARDHASYWTAILRDRPGKQLPAAAPAPGAADDQCGRLPVRVDPDLVAAIRSFARSSHTTPFVVLLAAHAAVLRERIGADDVLVAIAVARRRQPETHPLIGFFTGAICIRVHFGGDPTFAELIRRVHCDCMSGIAHEELDLTGYLHLVEPARDEDANPIACSGFFLQPPVPALALAGSRLEPVEVGQAYAPSEPEIALRDYGSAIRGHLNYSTRVLSPKSAASFADQFLHIVRAGLRQPGAPLSRLKGRYL